MYRVGASCVEDGVRGCIRADARVSLSKAGRAEARAAEPRRRAAREAIMIVVKG